MGQQENVTVRMTKAEKRGLEREAAQRKVSMSELMHRWARASLQRVTKKHAPTAAQEPAR